MDFYLRIPGINNMKILRNISGRLSIYLLHILDNNPVNIEYFFTSLKQQFRSEI